MSAPLEKPDCSQFEKVLDDLGAAQAITVISDKHPLPKSLEETEKKCALSLESIRKLRMYNKECNKALTQQVFSAILRTRNQLVEDKCKDPKSAEFNAMFESIRCIHENATDAVKQAETKTVLMSQVLVEADVKDEQERIKRACCDVLASKKHFMAAIKDKCGKYEKVYSDYVDSYTSESLALICSDAEKMEKDGECETLTPLKLDGVSLKYVSFLNPMLKIVKTLDH